LADAAESYQNALDLEPGEREVMMALGVALMRLNRFARAVEVFQQLNKLHADFEPAYCNLVHAYAELGEHERAEETFYLAQQFNEDCPHCFFSVGVSLAARSQYDRAVFCWKRALELEPGYMGVHQRISEAYRAKGELAKAREFALQAVRNDPGNIDLLYDLADLTLDMGKTAAAAAQLAQIIELEPDHLESHYTLARIWLRQHQHAKALASLDAIRTIAGDDPGLPDFHLHYGQALRGLGRFADARKALHDAAKREPTDPAVLMLLGDCYMADDRVAEAGDWYRRVLAVDAHNAFALHKLGICLIRGQRVEAGVKSCLAAIAAKPDFGAAMFNAAIGNLRLGRWHQARELLSLAERHDLGRPVRELRRRIWVYRLRHGLNAVNQWLGRGGPSAR
jgi:tetratricopeptide (TPR) repeat protein